MTTVRWISISVYLVLKCWTVFAVQGFKLRRKSRDPAKEIAEWYKIKGLVSKPKGMYSIVTCVCVDMYILMLQKESREKSKASSYQESTLRL